LLVYPKTWKVGRYPKKLNRTEIIQMGRELKIILRITKKIIKHKDKYTLEENIVFRNDNN
jgi:hypothetical protein